MAQDKKGFILYADQKELSTKELFNSLLDVNYKLNDRYCLCYINQNTYNRLLDIVSELIRRKEIDEREAKFYHYLFKHHYNNYYKIKNLEAEEPRKIAQAFIGKKKIRIFIFKRDKYKCLKCNSKENLSIDHIQAINKGGENKISNLQTLCRSCNSAKSDNYKDYRK